MEKNKSKDTAKTGTQLKVHPENYTYLKDTLSGEDEFGFHEDVAKSLKHLIDNSGESHIVALKGNWGSGKSSTIKLLEKEYKSDDKVNLFLFDAWEFENGYLRQAFLYKFIKWLKNIFKNEGLEDIFKNEYEKELSQILGKTKETERESKAENINQFGWLIWIASLLVVIPSIISILMDITKSSVLGIIIASILGILIIVLFCYLKKKNKKSNNDNKENNDKNSSVNVLGSIYSGMLIGKITDSEVTKSLVQNPIEFQEKYLGYLEKYFKHKNHKKLIVVIDNLDRVSPENALSLLTSLKPFFPQDNLDIKKENSESKNEDKVWYIIPFDPDGFLKNNKNKNTQCETLNKLFDVEFNLGSNLYIKWQKFLEKCMEESGLVKDSSKDEKDEKDAKLAKAAKALEISKRIIFCDSDFEENDNKKSQQNYNENQREDDKDGISKESSVNNHSEDEFFKSYIGINPTPREIKLFINNLLSIQIKREKMNERKERKKREEGKENEKIENEENEENVDFFYCCLAAAFQVCNIKYEIIDEQSYIKSIKNLEKFDYYEEELLKDSLAAIYFNESLKTVRIRKYENRISNSIQEGENINEEFKEIPEEYKRDVLKNIRTDLLDIYKKDNWQNILYWIVSIDSIKSNEKRNYNDFIENLAAQFFKHKNDNVVPVPFYMEKTCDKYIEGLHILYKGNFKKEAKFFLNRLTSNELKQDDDVNQIEDISISYLVISVCKIFKSFIDDLNLDFKGKVDETVILKEISKNENLEEKQLNFLSNSLTDESLVLVQELIENNLEDFIHCLNGMRIINRLSDNIYEYLKRYLNEIILS